MFIQDNMQTDRMFAKYSSLLSKSNIITPVELRRDMEENNVPPMSAFHLPVSFSARTTISVTAQESQYYDEHKHLYKQVATRDVNTWYFPSERQSWREDIEKVIC